MFATILRDVYKSSERRDMLAAIDDLCSPADALLWASTGLYVYFDPYRTADGPPGRNVLYIGLARDLSERFATHNGLRGGNKAGNKSQQIDNWFENHEFLGLSLLPQSPLAQVNTSREREALKRLDPSEPGPIVDNPDYGLVSIQLLEGQLIETYRQMFGSFPPWNSIGGAQAGSRRAKDGTAHGVLPLVDGSRDGLLCARLPLRALSASAVFGFFESEALHMARFYALFSPNGATDLSVRRALDLLGAGRFGPLIEDQVHRMDATGYLRNLAGSQFDVIRWVIENLDANDD